jgi:hypothetical protein
MRRPRSRNKLSNRSKEEAKGRYAQIRRQNKPGLLVVVPEKHILRLRRPFEDVIHPADTRRRQAVDVRLHDGFVESRSLADEARFLNGVLLDVLLSERGKGQQCEGGIGEANAPSRLRDRSRRAVHRRWNVQERTSREKLSRCRYKSPVAREGDGKTHRVQLAPHIPRSELTGFIRSERGLLDFEDAGLAVRTTFGYSGSQEVSEHRARVWRESR